ncbi:MAG: molybdopterin molybdotransferase MoeA [Synergistaceae bacterium]|jgi:molybdopterin molybdotransferase|nr:molybdopterin molybdotransferase MoeA [Synergistaceae bacterium]
MSGFVEEVKPIDECLNIASASLGFPWEVMTHELKLENSLSFRVASEIQSREQSPPFTRSLRDGYAVKSADTAGASQGSPVFLKISGEVATGMKPDFEISRETAAPIPTGGMLPDGADAVVMLEDTEKAGGWVEIRSSVQRGESLAFAGEEIEIGDVLIAKGEMIDCSILGLLAAFGVASVDVLDLKIGIISTGDEITPVGMTTLQPGFIRDANTYIVRSALKKYGFESESFGIASDRWEDLKSRAEDAIQKCDIVLLSGGSSVGAHDNTALIMESLSAPGLIAHGINMAPGKPTIIGGSANDKKLVVGLPGHPLSCMTSVLFVVIPMILALAGSASKYAGRYMNMPLDSDVQGRTGIDEFIPMRVENGMAHPMAAKSGYVSAMRYADGFIRMRPHRETLRAGEDADVWLW